MPIHAVKAAVLLSLLLAPFAAVAEEPSSLQTALSSGTPNLDLRLRYENVEQDFLQDSAEAFTSRIRLGYTSAAWRQLDAQLEFEDTRNIGADRFNSTENGHTTFPIVADPESDSLNQAWLRYSGIPKTTLKVGRQRIVYDNARFIGNVGWRQNEQTYDALTLNSTFFSRTTLNYAYISNISSFKFHTIGDRLTDSIDIRAHAFNLAFDVSPALKAGAYAYLFDFSEIPAPALARQDTRTLGLRLSGKLPLQALELSYTGELAHQNDYADAPTSVDAAYSLLEAGVSYRKLSLKLGREVLGGDGVYSFQTPLATLHNFQGWADQLLVTPVNGVEDLYVAAGAKLEQVSLLARWHDYQADHGSRDYGHELELQATRPFGSHVTVGIKFAAYSADSYPVAGTPPSVFDTRKTWLWAEYRL